MGRGDAPAAHATAASAASATATAFDEAAWRQRLLALNPWAAGLTFDGVSFPSPVDAEHRSAMTRGGWREAPGGGSPDAEPGPAVEQAPDPTDAAFTAARKAACLARWQAGKDTWKTWAEAMLALRKQAEAAGAFKVTKKYDFSDEEGETELSRAWLALADADFRAHAFTGSNRFDFGTFIFPARASFDNAQFGTKEQPGDAGFERATFTGTARFERATFTGDAGFEGATFTGAARFERATFTGDAGFADATFTGAAWFADATFTGDAGFERATFTGDAWFADATFTGTAWFERATFTGDAGFEGATFTGDARFADATFTGAARFADATFTGDAGFGGATFTGDAGFERATFTGDAGFERATFTGDAGFEGATFEKNTYFSPNRITLADVKYLIEKTQFQKSVSFNQARFNGPITFAEVQFGGPADFSSIHSKVAFSLGGATFTRTPDFIEATFHEPPRLDNVTIPKPLVKRAALEDDPRGASGFYHRFALASDGNEHARFRKLRKMAADGKDHENEIRFNAHEIAARRFWVDEPRFFGSKKHDGAGRFWIGWLYSKVSDYGQSLGRPLAFWLLALLVFWPLYLMVPGAPETSSPTAAPHASSQLAAPHPNPLPTERVGRGNESPGRWFIRPWEAVGAGIAALPSLVPSFRCHPSYDLAVSDNGGQPLQPTSAFWEGLVLSFRNALVFDRSDVSRRMYGCLYGIQSKGGEDYPFIPRLVTFLSTAQSFLSALFLFLAGLGLRNMYRVK